MKSLRRTNTLHFCNRRLGGFREKGILMSNTQNAPIAPGGAPAAPLPKSGMAVASLVLGIVAAVTSFLPIINNLSFILAVQIGRASCRERVY